jgi:pimeloyl-ACP methyl ester carboxylesterase
MAEIKTPHGLLHYTIQGEGPALILLHNGFEDSRTWNELGRHWADRFKVIAYDRPGFGLSSLPDKETYTDLVEQGREELSLLIESLHIEKAFLTGHCLGAAIAFSYAAAHPKKIQGIVSEACGFYSDEQIRESCRIIFCPWEDVAHKYRHELITMHRGEKQARLFWELCRSHTSSYVMSSSYDLRPLLADIRCPVLVAAGDDDFLFSVEHTLSGFRCIPDARLWIAPDAGHNLHRQHSGAFAAAADTFLQHCL